MVEFTKDDQRRLFSGWGTISVVDRQNDYIDVLKEFRDAGVMEKMMQRGAPVMDSHSNHQVGRIISYEYKIAPSGQPGLYLVAEIFKNYPSDDEFWEALKEGKYSGFSLGGKASDKTPICNQDGCHNNLTGIESWEWSAVSVPANQEALIDSVNKLAKSLKFSKDDAKKIGDKLKIDWNKIDINEFLQGLEIELEHGKKNELTNITNDDEEMTAKIALAHLLEFPNYYSKSRGLPKMEDTLKKARVYIKYPSDAPKNAQVYTGTQGGKYYETEEMNVVSTQSPSKLKRIDQLTNQAKIRWEPTLKIPSIGFILNDGFMISLEEHQQVNELTGSISQFMRDANAIRIRSFTKDGIFVELDINQNPNNNQWNQLKDKKVITYDISDGNNHVAHGKVKSISEMKASFEKLKNPSQTIKNLINVEKSCENPILKYIQQSKILKAKVYVKNPSDVPQGVKLEEGERGGHYYESGQTSQEVEYKPEEKPQHYEGLKGSSYYKGFDGKYDIFHFENAVVKVNPQDLPSDVTNRVLQCSDSFKFSSLKKKPNIIFLGKSVHHLFTWEDRSGQNHDSESGGTAEYSENAIKLWDDFTINNIVYHEVGHFVEKNLFQQERIKIYPSIEGFEMIEDINKYDKMVEILKNHNVPIDLEHIIGILDDRNYTKNLNILSDMYANGLNYYDEGYSTLFALKQRLRRDNPIELPSDEVKEWKKFRTRLKAEIKSNTLRSEWIDIYKSEGYINNNYADRNYSECFAEFYQTMDITIREPIISQRQATLKFVSEKHPKKFAFFKKYVMKKWLK